MDVSKYLKPKNMEELSKFKIKSRPKLKKEKIIVKRQNFRIFLFYILIFILIFIVLNEYVYEYITITRGGLNHFTLCENMLIS